MTERIRIAERDATVPGIISRFELEGIESVMAEDSAEIKGEIRENGSLAERCKELFPLEYVEVLDEC